MSALSERACTALGAHAAAPREAETVVQHGLTYIVLRCVVCDRPQGMRLIRRKK